MDPGLGPPQQSPDDYSARERRERTGVAVGISLGVFILFAGPLCLVYFANWRRKRKRRRNELRDLEGTTAVSQSEKDGTARLEHTNLSTLTTTVVAREDAEADFAEWREIQRLRGETDLERLKRDPSSPLNTYPITQPPKALTSDEVLGLDKASYLQNLPIATASSSNPEQPSSITVLPSQLPSFGRPDSQGGASKKTQNSGGDKCVSPWMVEHEPNPVIWSHLRDPKGEMLDQDAATQRQGGEASTQNQNINEDTHDPLLLLPASAPRFNLTIQEAQPIPEYHFVGSHWDHSLPFETGHEAAGRDRKGSKESCPSDETTISSPSTSNGSQDSSDPLIDRRSSERDSQSPTTFRVPEVYHPQQITVREGSAQESTYSTGRTSCRHCNRHFKTTGQLK